MTATIDQGAAAETWACPPEREGYVEREGVRVHWELFGSGDRTVLLLPSWSIVPARVWKGQVAHLARRARVVVFDPRGNGRSDRPTDSSAYDLERVRRRRACRPRCDRHGARGRRRPVDGCSARARAGRTRTRACHASRLRRSDAADHAEPAPPQSLVHRRARDLRRLGEVQRASLAPRLPRLRRVLLSPVPAGAALDEAARRPRRLGPADRC